MASDLPGDDVEQPGRRKETARVRKDCTETEWRLLRMLCENGPLASAASIVTRRLGVGRDTLSRNARALERKGLCTCERDGMRLYLRPTSKAADYIRARMLAPAPDASSAALDASAPRAMVAGPALSALPAVWGLPVSPGLPALLAVPAAPPAPGAPGRQAWRAAPAAPGLAAPRVTAATPRPAVGIERSPAARLPDSQEDVLAAMGRTARPVAASRLAELTGLGYRVVHRQAQRLYRKGYVSRIREERRWLWSLTEKGRAHLQGWLLPRSARA